MGMRDSCSCRFSQKFQRHLTIFALIESIQIRQRQLILRRMSENDSGARPQMDPDQLFDIVAKGKVKIEVQQRFALKDAAEAHRALQARKTTGSTILTI